MRKGVHRVHESYFHHVSTKKAFSNPRQQQESSGKPRRDQSLYIKMSYKRKKEGNNWRPIYRRLSMTVSQITVGYFVSCNTTKHSRLRRRRVFKNSSQIKPRVWFDSKRNSPKSVQRTTRVSSKTRTGRANNGGRNKSRVI